MDHVDAGREESRGGMTFFFKCSPENKGKLNHTLQVFFAAVFYAVTPSFFLVNRAYIPSYF